MTAIDSYELFVGEIGINRREYLYEVTFWEMRRILRGYRNRYRDMWSAIRWHAYRMTISMPYLDVQKAGISNPTDLIKFPWDEEAQPLTEEEIDDLHTALAEEMQMLESENRPRDSQ